MYKYSFERLEVWTDARLLVRSVYSSTKEFPSTEKFGLCTQIQRAVVPVPSNIAEGMSQESNKEQLRFIEIAFGSLMEVYCQLYLSMDLDYITKSQFDELKPEIDKISNKLNTLSRSIKKRV